LGRVTSTRHCERKGSIDTADAKQSSDFRVFRLLRIGSIDAALKLIQLIHSLTNFFLAQKTTLCYNSYVDKVGDEKMPPIA